ncbi:TetR/AcrR family transcriptional regulator [Bacillus sp. T33-2]|uniref:TetR/AcrR family transcriptional regulator n=1 Tax=Bacillus sp. T33-2 TaxID=2054168 RepID=UPI000C7722AB|nr:TetR family transcriptional regulator C-terminal domain-containing protein [Bacillus sp. T33-2]PLR91971.1 TetR family transcriptional regulator [Bacillus sp. T33-2]
MPKIVDHEKQKEKVAEAAWRVIRREGIAGATVRKIAVEAGISTGSMRHYFSTQSDLFAFSMNLVSKRVKNRIQNIKFTGNPLTDAETLLFEFLPLDEERSAEMEVWIVFYIKALSDPVLHSLGTQFYEEMKAGITFIIDTLIKNGIARNDLNREIEIETLYALIDGLALHGIVQPGQLSHKKLKSTIQHYLKTICREN